MRSIDKRELVNLLCIKGDYTRKQATTFLRCLIAILRQELLKKGEFRISGVGTIVVKERPRRRVWSNLKKDYVDVERRHRLQIKTSNTLARQLRENSQEAPKASS